MKTSVKSLLYIVGVVVIFLCGWLLYRYVYNENVAILEGVVECRTYRVSSKLAGRIDSLMVEEGDWVLEGDLLYTISTPELDAKLQQVTALEAAAEALNMEAESGVRWEEVAAAKSLWHKALAGQELAEKSLARVKNLYDKGVVPRQQYDEAVANFEAMQASQQAARYGYDMALDGATRQQRAALAAKVREAQGAVDEVRAYMRDSRLYAPISGRVSNIISEPGELVSVGYPVVTMLDLSHCWVVFNIKESDISDVTLGAMFQGYLPALDKSVEFEVYYIASEADFATWSATRARGGFDIRTFEVRARPIGDNVAILPGMSVVVDDIK